MVLWKKRSTRDDALLVDLAPSESTISKLTIRGYLLCARRDINARKNDEFSTTIRLHDNEKFKAECWGEAIELYNESLRFATEGSENISLAYANRSACFLHIGKYNECLADIELATSANYPQRLMPKLNQRKAECSELMKESKNVVAIVKPELSFDPDEMFPCMANVLEIRSSDEFGKHIVTNRKLKVGQIILVEEAFVFESEKRDRVNCETCLKLMTNFIPCPNCTDVMFCRTKCMETNDIHKIGCGASYHGVPSYRLLIESILIAVNAFSDNIDELMKFVEKCLVSRDVGLLEGISGSKLQYGLFLKLTALQREVNRTIIADVYQLLFHIPKIKQLFDSKQTQRFLMHLILQHYLILETNGISFDKHISVEVLGNIMSLFNHAWYYNTAVALVGNRIIGFVTRPIERGEQLFISYIMKDILSTQNRKARLRIDFQFECKCSMCAPCSKHSDRIRMQSDSTYKLLKLDESKLKEKCMNSVKRRIWKEKFRKFLSKYGRLPWSPELNQALIAFIGCMSLDFQLFESC